MRGEPRPTLSADRRGTVLVESMVVFPVLLLITIGVFEFGNLMWQRQQLQIGVRDAARYWSRCRPDFSSCSLNTAREIAFRANAAGVGQLRVPGWDEASELEISPETPPLAPDASDIVIVSGTVVYRGSPLFSAVFGDAIAIKYWHTERYLGW